jgi:hypothetical protein
MSKITNYHFGKIQIADQIYTRDLIVTPIRIIPNWKRAEGHLLALADLRAPLDEFKPEILVLGIGKFGLMKVPETVRRELQSRQIEVFVLKTSAAVVKFNELTNPNILGAFHLTC